MPSTPHHHHSKDIIRMDDYPSRFLSLLDDDTLSDFTLRFPSSGRFVRLHKAIVSVSSEFFKSCLKGSNSEIIAWPDDSEVQLTALLRAAYTGELTVPKSDRELADLLVLVHKYQFIQFASRLSVIFMDRLDKRNVLELFPQIVAFSQKLPKALEKAKSIILKKTTKKKKFILHDAVLEYDAEALLALLDTCRNIRNISLQPLVLKWICHDQVNREGLTFKLMQRIIGDQAKTITGFASKVLRRSNSVLSVGSSAGQQHPQLPEADAPLDEKSYVYEKSDNTASSSSSLSSFE